MTTPISRLPSRPNIPQHEESNVKLTPPHSPLRRPSTSPPLLFPRHRNPQNTPPSRSLRNRLARFPSRRRRNLYVPTRSRIRRYLLPVVLSNRPMLNNIRPAHPHHLHPNRTLPSKIPLNALTPLQHSKQCLRIPNSIRTRLGIHLRLLLPPPLLPNSPLSNPTSIRILPLPLCGIPLRGLRYHRCVYKKNRTILTTHLVRNVLHAIRIRFNDSPPGYHRLGKNNHVSNHCGSRCWS